MGKYIELHCHFDGSLNVEKSYELAKERNILPEDMSYEQFAKEMPVPSDNVSLETFLDHFTFPLAILQDKEAIYESMIACISDLEKDNVCYAEIRFAPQAHLLKGLTQEETVIACIDGVNKAKELYKDITVQLILCMMCDDIGDSEVNLETARLAAKYYGQGVCALDLAGIEGLVPYSNYEKCISIVKEKNVPVTLHAGESGPASNVHDALKVGADRIGHGGHALEDSAVIQELLDKKVVLEQCVTSNIQCHNQPSYDLHAIRPLFDAGIKVTVNTDNRSLSGTTLQKEIDKLKKYMHFTDEEIHQMMLYAVDGAFTSEEEKERLRKLV